MFFIEILETEVHFSQEPRLPMRSPGVAPRAPTLTIKLLNSRLLAPYIFDCAFQMGHFSKIFYFSKILRKYLIKKKETMCP